MSSSPAATPTFFSPNSSSQSSSAAFNPANPLARAPQEAAGQEVQDFQPQTTAASRPAVAASTPSPSPAPSAASSASASASSAAAAGKPKPVARTTFQSFGASGFSGFGRQSSVQYDLSGNLDDQCRDAIKNNDSAGVTKLLQAGANARYVDHTGNSLLHLAAMFDRFDIATQLIAKGASLTEKNSAGETPMDIAPPSMQHKLTAQLQHMQAQTAA